jgi:hypothetical protein
MSVPSTKGVRRYPLPAVGWKVLVAGLLIRESFSFWTGHPYDFEIWVRTGAVVAHGVNPYISFWPPVSPVSFAFLQQTLPSAAYLPFWPLLLGGLYHFWEFAGGGDRFVLYFLLKQPPIIGDVVTAYLLFQVVRRWSGTVAAGLAALSFWSFFPYAIIVSSIWGQFDSLMVVVLLSLLLVQGPLERNLVNGVGIFVKYLTAIFLPLEFFRERGARRAWFLLALAIPLGLTILTFFAMGWGFHGIQASATSETHGGGGGMNYAFSLSFGSMPKVVSQIPYFYDIVGYLWVPAVIIGGWIAARWVRPGGPSAELRALMLVTTLFLLTRWGLNEQYMLYIFSLLLIDVLSFHPQRRQFLYAIIGLAFAFLLVNNTLGIWFPSPLGPGFQNYVSGIDNSPVLGTVRVFTLLGISLMMTVTLIQLIWVFFRDEPSPRPWFLPPFHRSSAGGELTAARHQPSGP